MVVVVDLQGREKDRETEFTSRCEPLWDFCPTMINSSLCKPLLGSRPPPASRLKQNLSLRRFWLQFSTEDGAGAASAVSLDNISFSMDCFMTCEYRPVPSHLAGIFEPHGQMVVAVKGS